MQICRRINNNMNASRHLYGIGAIMAILTAASFGSGHFKGGAPSVSGNVVVANTATQPVPTRDLTLSGRTPITVESPELIIPDGSGGTGYVPFYTVPAGKRLIIQTLYGGGSSDFGEPLGLSVMKVTGASGIHVFPLPFESKQPSTAATGEAEYFLNNVTLEVDPNSSMVVAVSRNGFTDKSFASVGVSGYLENAS
jgi:hypothetical protein